ncbi:MAG: hypothetical protein JOZ41_04210 [Chloroflexi bacterium]|nr:hypothetical protein [Chloroflexota bacterium]
MRSLALCALLLIAILRPPLGAHAQTGTTQVLYSAGWNLVGGPPGMDFSSALALYTYGPGGYVAPAILYASLCQGYWADFRSAVSLPLPRSALTSARPCPVQAGWNLVGNPFAVVAELPAGTVAFAWDPGAGSYVPASSIGVGRAVWVYSAAPAALTLQPASPSASTIVIQGFPPPGHGPYQVHVGDTVSLILPVGSDDIAQATPSLLALQDSGQDDGGRFWLWRAVAPGLAQILLSPGCRDVQPPCTVPSLAIEVDILA